MALIPPIDVGDLIDELVGEEPTPTTTVPTTDAPTTTTPTTEPPPTTAPPTTAPPTTIAPPTTAPPATTAPTTTRPSATTTTTRRQSTPTLTSPRSTPPPATPGGDAPQGGDASGPSSGGAPSTASDAPVTVELPFGLGRVSITRRVPRSAPAPIPPGETAPPVPEATEAAPPDTPLRSDVRRSSAPQRDGGRDATSEEIALRRFSGGAESDGLRQALLAMFFGSLVVTTFVLVTRRLSHHR